MGIKKHELTLLRNRILKERFDALYTSLPYSRHTTKINIVYERLEFEFFLTRHSIVRIIKRADFLPVEHPLYRNYQKLKQNIYDRSTDGGGQPPL